MRWFIWFNVSFNLRLLFQHYIYIWGDPEVFVKYMSQLVNPLVSWFRPLDPKSNQTSRIRSWKTTFPGCGFLHSFSTGITSRSKDFCLREFLNCLCKELGIFFPKSPQLRNTVLLMKMSSWILCASHLSQKQIKYRHVGWKRICVDSRFVRRWRIWNMKPRYFVTPNHSFWVNRSEVVYYTRKNDIFFSISQAAEIFSWTAWGWPNQIHSHGA